MSRQRCYAQQLGLLAVLMVLGGCTVGPDFKAPPAPAIATYGADALPAQTETSPGLGGQAQKFVAGQAVPSRWWTQFGSPALNALVDAALAANPDLQAAEHALRVARENAAAQQGVFAPAVDLQLQPTRSKAAEVDSAPVSLHTGQLNISYALDVFGGNKRQAEALGALVDVQHFQREAVYQTLVANIVNAAIGEASLRAQIQATQGLIQSSEKLLDIAQRQHRAGEVGGADVATQEAALAQMQATLPPLEKQLVQQRNQLAVLAGRLPSEQVPLDFALDTLTLPLELPVSLPSLLVAQRPDVRAAEAQLHAASAQIGVAVAERLPNLTLTASVGRFGTSAADMLKGSSFWSLGAGLLQPVFHGGALMHQQKAAEAGYDQAAAQYRSTVLTAFQNTADTLQAIVSDAQTLRAAKNAEAAAQKSFAMQRRKRELGAASQADLVLAQQTYQQAALTLVQAQASRYTDTVALYQALGGWWKDAPKPQAP